MTTSLMFKLDSDPPNKRVTDIPEMTVVLHPSSLRFFYRTISHYRTSDFLSSNTDRTQL